MSVDRGRGFKSKTDWLETGLRILSEGGVDRVKDDILARSLGVARSGFYWHFGNRSNFLGQLIDYWGVYSTGQVLSDPGLPDLEPRDRLMAIARAVRDDELAKYDLAVRNWAVTDENAETVVRDVYRRRREFISGIFRELGFEGAANDARVSLFVCFQTWNTFTFLESGPQSDDALAAQIDLMVTDGTIC